MKAALCFLLVASFGYSQDGPAPSAIRTYKTAGGTELKASIYNPTATAGTGRAAIILFHGGGWVAGSPNWMAWDAKRYADKGLVAITAQYRLADQKSITPLECMEDARDVIRWVRRNAADLGVDPNRIAAFGSSAGGHLAVSAVLFEGEPKNDTSAVPNALILMSPAVSLAEDPWPQMLLGKRAKPSDISPVEHMSKKLPPILVFEGDADLVTPLAGARRFCARAKELGGNCEIQVYQGLGHVMNRKLDRHSQEEGPFDLDPKAVEDSHVRGEQFLAELGYLPSK